MRINIQPPNVNTDPDVPKVKVIVATNVCASEAYTIIVPSQENRYIPALSWGLSDDECDMLLETLAGARAERLQQQEQAYEALHAKFGGSWDNEPVIPLELAEDGE